MSSENARLLRLSVALALGGFGIGSGEFVIMGLMNRVAMDLQVAVPDVGYAVSSYALGVVVGAPLIEDAQTMAASMNHAAFNMANALGAWLAGVTIKAGAVWSATGLVGAALAIGGLLIFFAGRKLERRDPPYTIE